MSGTKPINRLWVGKVLSVTFGTVSSSVAAESANGRLSTDSKFLGPPVTKQSRGNKDFGASRSIVQILSLENSNTQEETIYVFSSYGGEEATRYVNKQETGRKWCYCAEYERNCI